MTNCPGVPDPTSLKEALEFAGALCVNNGLKDSVGQELERRVSGYSNKIAVDTYFKSSLKNLDELREKLVNDIWIYGSYDKLSSKPPDCLANTVSDCFPKLYCTLSYFNFNVNADAYGGGKWADLGCQSGNLADWLQNNNGIPSAPSQSYQAKLWSGGFRTNELWCSQASDLSTELRKCVEDNGSKFPMLLSGILFLQPSLPELTSTFLVLVKEICIIVTGENEDIEWNIDGFESRNALQGKFKTQYNSYPDYVSLKQCCSSLKSSMEQLIGGKSSDGALRIPNSSHELYFGMLNSDKFSVYLIWLSQHLGSLIANLQQMETDCTNWDPQKMSGGQTPDPFLYGFGFPHSGSWGHGKDQQIKSIIMNAISKLTDEGSAGSLAALKRHVENLIGSSTSSFAGSIAGSLLGTAAVSGAGAAVALNVGGVTTALKGAIGILK
ncbi:secreted antigen 1 [Babesia caballi]|uniref:Secreted antigen 1 n=1 Tax=Babesia caballi TaxID=5871 RepID=A0AAV4LQD6_BABCB|nr:secreted antigen 1 [Babesia caballi]